jgi:hypothetical protein
MFRRSSLALLLVIASCGGADPHDATTPTEDAPACPSEAAPEKCRDLAQAAAGANKGALAWAYTVLECQSPTGAQCVAMWQSYSKLAPTQTDALNLLHTACDHNSAACEALAAWHTQRGHALAAAAYQKRAGSAGQEPRSATALALATDLAAVMHVSDSPPRTDAIGQMVGRELRAPVARAAAKVAKPKAWPMHAATLSSDTDDKCAPTAKLDREQVPLARCVSEVRPFDEDQIAIRNRCGQAVTVAYAGARADRTTFVKQVRLEPFEALSAGISHRELGQLTYAVCSGDCRVTSAPDDASASWSGTDGYYYCAAGGQP